MIRVLVVDDDDLTAAAHAEYVRRIDGFEVAGIAGTAHGASLPSPRTRSSTLCCST